MALLVFITGCSGFPGPLHTWPPCSEWKGELPANPSPPPPPLQGSDARALPGPSSHQFTPSLGETRPGVDLPHLLPAAKMSVGWGSFLAMEGVGAECLVVREDRPGSPSEAALRDDPASLSARNTCREGGRTSRAGRRGLEEQLLTGEEAGPGRSHSMSSKSHSRLQPPFGSPKKPSLGRAPPAALPGLEGEFPGPSEAPQRREGG